jgi:tetratricopeptide (TPR) repeat protein
MTRVSRRLDPKVVEILGRAKALLTEGKLTEALACYTAAFAELTATGDHFQASNVAHMAGVADSDPHAKLRWNTQALQEANAVDDRDSVAPFYASLYNNLAVSHSLLGDRDEAVRCLRAAWSHVGAIEPGPYAERVTETIRKRLADLEVRS